MEVVKGDCASYLQANKQTLSVDSGKTYPTPKDLTIVQRYQIGNPTVGPLGESPAKYEFLVSYDAPRRSNQPIVPTGWDRDVEPNPGETKVVEIGPGQHKKEKQPTEDEEPIIPNQADLSPLEADMIQAGILPMFEQHATSADWEPVNLPNQISP